MGVETKDALAVKEFYSGKAYFNNDVRYEDGVNLFFGTADDASIQWNTGQTNDALSVQVGATSNSVMIIQKADVAYDFAHSNQTHPTLYVHSANQSATQWLALSHNGTDGVITAGAGTVNIAGTINLAGATKTSTGDTATDGYVTIEVAGASVKLATIA
tara:strand:- start:2721 stop:3197 length:477 start_codon:yes stop_codon:yes gene_type:complete